MTDNAPPPALPEELQRLIETFAEACYAVGQDSEIAGTKAIERSATYRDKTKAALVSGIAALVQRVTDAETQLDRQLSTLAGWLADMDARPCWSPATRPKGEPPSELEM